MMGPNGDLDFDVTEVILIGNSDWDRPLDGLFVYHEVAWTGAGSWTDPLYDACLEVDSSSNPWSGAGGNHVAKLAILPFTTQGISPGLPIPTPFTSWSYRERLCDNTDEGIGRCTPYGTAPGSNSGRRRLQ